jgi:hypothetical protein
MTIPAGEAGTDATVKVIGRMVSDAAHRPGIRQLAIQIVTTAGVTGKDQYSQAVALFQWVKNNIGYIGDIRGIETVAHPLVTLQSGAGDCDDQAALVSALAESIGIPTRLKVVGNHPDCFQHIFAELFVNGQWRPADTTETNRLGDRADGATVEKVYNLQGVSDMAVVTNSSGIRISLETLNKAIFNAVLATIRGNWNAGLINRTDLKSYLHIIDSGNSPGRGTTADPAMRAAITYYLGEVDRLGLPATKPDGLTGLEGLNGFFGSVWNAVKGTVSKLVNIGASLIPGGAAAKTELEKALKKAASIIQEKSEPVLEAYGNAYIENQTGLPAGIISAMPWLIVAGVIGFVVLRRPRRRR